MTGGSVGPLDIIGAFALACVILGVAWVLLCVAVGWAGQAWRRVQAHRRRNHPTIRHADERGRFRR